MEKESAPVHVQRADGRRGETVREIGCAVTPRNALERCRRRIANCLAPSHARGDERRACRPRLSRVLRRRLVAFFLLARACRVDLPLASRAPPPRVARLASASSPRELVFTYLGGNGWRVHFPRARARVLCDPWLVGDPTFWNLPALYVGRGPHVADVPTRTLATSGPRGGRVRPPPPLAGIGRPRAPTHPPRASQRYPRRRLPRRRVRGAPPRIPRRPRGARRRSRRGRGSHRLRRRGPPSDRRGPNARRRSSSSRETSNDRYRTHYECITNRTVRTTRDRSPRRCVARAERWTSP